MGTMTLLPYFMALSIPLIILDLTPEIRDHIIMKYYEAGHMMYTHHPSLIKFKEDVGSFILEQSK